MNQSLLMTLSKNGVSVNDVNYLDIYDDYREMKKQGTKVRYIALCLADKYGLTDRAIFKIVKRLGQQMSL
jgi:orotate phosphoribosyltransferase-like protein